jgi:hemerythrin-like domain-containing protein
MDHDLLSRHHQDLERQIGALLTKADGGDGHELQRQWSLFEGELLRHIELEEREVLPAFAQEDPKEASALRQEHARLRGEALALGIRADLHHLRAEAVRLFIADLRSHAAHEERVLYPWAAARVPPDTWTAIARGLREVRQTVARQLSDLGSKTL